MKLPRRQFLNLAAGAAVLPGVSRIASARSYPSRPVRIMVGVAAGSANDILARLIGQWLSERLGQPFIVENRPGAATNIATAAVVRAPPDGYTLLMFAPSSAVNATLYEKLDFVFSATSFRSRASFVSHRSCWSIHRFQQRPFPSSSATRRLIRAKSAWRRRAAAPVAHIAGELFKMMAGVDIVHVPYRGGAPALTDLLAGQVQVMFPVPSSSIEYIRQGTLRPLAVTTATRWDALPDIPTIGEFLSGYEASTWFGFGAPRNTPADIVDTLNKVINAGLADPKMRSRLDDLGGGVFASSPAEFGKLITNETEKWGKVVRFAGIKGV